jgi:ATP-binding cassette, subfamily B, bacterial PglK
LKKKETTLKLIIRLWRHINIQRRMQLIFLLFLILSTSFVEIFSIGAIFPFIAALTSPDRLFNNSFLYPLFQKMGLISSSQLLIPVTIIFSGTVLVAGALRLILIRRIAKISFSTGADIGYSIYERTLHQPYIVHCSRNSSDLISSITGKTNSVTNNVILSTLNFLSSLIIVIPILLILFYINFTLTILTFISFLFFYFLIVQSTQKRIRKDSECVAQQSTQVIQCLNEGIGGIRDILIDGSQKVFCDLFNSANLKLRSAQSRQFIISSSPKYALEALGMVVIAGIAYYLTMESDDIARVVPTLGVLALAAQRILPLLQQAYSAYIDIQSGHSSLQDVLQLLDQPLTQKNDYSLNFFLPFNNLITLKNVSFEYTNQNSSVLKNINLIIKKGSRIGFIGPTGSGKSTLLDIIMGLLSPSKGHVEVDGMIITFANNFIWQRHIAHVPQTIFLADSSIEENIAFGVPKEQIDSNRVLEVAKQVQLAEVIESWPMQYQTFVGERGVRLSGGQRQRIGIARALYKRADVIVFDEATSSLDNETEQAVMSAIEALSDDLTILIIAHRLTTLKNCSEVVELKDGAISRVGSYQQMVSH